MKSKTARLLKQDLPGGCNSGAWKCSVHNGTIQNGACNSSHFAAIALVSQISFGNLHSQTIEVDTITFRDHQIPHLVILAPVMALLTGCHPNSGPDFQVQAVILGE